MWSSSPVECASNQRQSECCPQLRTESLLETQYMGALSRQRLTHSSFFYLSLPPVSKNEMIGVFVCF